jgi:hypothetical protein
MANILVLRLSECKSRIRDTGTFNASHAATRSSVPHIEEQRAKASSSSSIEPQSSFSGLLSGVVAGTGEEVVVDSFSDRQVPNAPQAGTALALLRPLLTRVAAVVEEMWWPSQMTVLGAGVWAPLRPTRPSVRDGEKGVVWSCSHSDGAPPSKFQCCCPHCNNQSRKRNGSQCCTQRNGRTTRVVHQCGRWRNGHQ